MKNKGQGQTGSDLYTLLNAHLLTLNNLSIFIIALTFLLYYPKLFSHTYCASTKIVTFSSLLQSIYNVHLILQDTKTVNNSSSLCIYKGWLGGPNLKSSFDPI